MDSFFRNIRSFLGLPKLDDRNYYRDDEGNTNDFNDSRYDAFSDPFEMHRYFEQQMNKILRNFDIFEFGKNDPLFGDIPGHNEIEIFNFNSDSDVQEEGSLRDQFLKPGFERPHSHSRDKKDEELDENRININDLDSVVSGNYFKKEFDHPKVTTKFFGRSISTKTVMNPDGSMEIHKTVRDNDGNEEITITKKIGDKEHTIIKKRDRLGKEEIVENLINIDEKDASNSLLNITEKSDSPWSLFDKFFK